MATVQVSVPATTANLGPGFDCIGAALTLANRFEFTRLPDGAPLQITACGEDAEKIATDASNYVYQSFCKLFQTINQAVPPLQLQINAQVPLARGLGSSATAIVGGLVGANVLAGHPLDQSAIAALATEIEGHPDNVVPALLGGCRLAASTTPSSGPSGVGDRPWEICEIPWHGAVVPVVAIPEFELSTAAARSVLPAQYSRADAIFNTAHLGLLLRAVETANPDWLRAALQDRIHQPYRQTLIPGFEAVQSGAIAAGAYGLVISGAGPTLLALTAADQAEAVAQAMVAAWQGAGISARALPLQVDTQGTVVQEV